MKQDFNKLIADNKLYLFKRREEIIIVSSSVSLMDEHFSGSMYSLNSYGSTIKKLLKIESHNWLVPIVEFSLENERAIIKTRLVSEKQSSGSKVILFNDEYRTRNIHESKVIYEDFAIKTNRKEEVESVYSKYLLMGSI
jgi:hypothetical protein